MIYSQFKKKILKKGRFEQFAISPYNMGEMGQSCYLTKILIISDQVESMELLKKRNNSARADGIIIPFYTDIITSMHGSISEIADLIMISAPFFTIYDLFTGKSLYTMGSDGVIAIPQKET